MVADELRRQADQFVDIADLESYICRDVSPRPPVREAVESPPPPPVVERRPTPAVRPATARKTVSASGPTSANTLDFPEPSDLK